ncbi:hypothetical protein OHT76_32925 [Streptomyces sp. NBC_00287]|uniref:tetratricopeptide repeat protein n=1 Tax=Streptomyces sp. NBC_00287 TaxID=2975702 RepID=UPI002E2A06CF|nr:tetratricopeptide repeat protein [Streptomyces sp. NBC_00287]
MDGPEPPGDPLGVLHDDRPEPERVAALRRLADLAAGAGPGALNRYAAGLLAAGRREEAEQVWAQLVAGRPDMVVARFNLATCLVAGGDVEACARVLRACLEGAPPGSREWQLAERRLDDLAEAGDDAERQNRMLRLRVAALRERVALGLAEPGDFKRLARALYGQMHVADSGVTGRDMLEAARLAYAAEPEDPEALEALVLGLLVAGTERELSEALRKLEKVAPHSRALGLARTMRTDPEFEEAARARRDTMREVMRRAVAGDRAAEDELRAESQKFAGNFEYRVALLFAAYRRGDHAETRRLADALAAEPAADHHVHFHIAQFYWFLGEHERSRHHFALAHQTAATEGDREDAREALRTVGAGTPEELGLE